MALAVGQFEQIANELSERTAELLSAQVSVTDERGIVVARSGVAVGPAFDRPLDELAREYLRVPLRYGAHIGEVIVGEPGGDEPISPKLAQALIDLMITQTAVISRLPNQHELKNKFIHDLLAGAIDDEADILREGQILGMDFSRPRAVVLLDASEYIHGRRGPGSDEAAAQRRVKLVIASIVGFFDLPDDTICGYIGNGEIAILKASATKDLEAWSGEGAGPALTGPSWANLHALKRAAEALLTRLRRDTGAAITAGIGRYHPGVRGLAQSYRDAGVALSLGQRFHGANHVHCLDELGVAAFVGVSDELTKVELARHLLSPLNGEPELRHTLHVFFAENCCPSATARELGVHRNTLSYRLDKIATLTGLDPRRFDDAVQIRLAMLLPKLRTDAP